MSGLEISSFVHLGWKKGKRAEARFLFLGVSSYLHFRWLKPNSLSRFLSGAKDNKT